MNKLQQYKLKRGIGIGLIVISAVLLVLFAAGVVLFGVNDVSLRAAPAGDALTVMDYGQPYEDPGCEARLCGSRFFRNGFFIISGLLFSAVEAEFCGNIKLFSAERTELQRIFRFPLKVQKVMSLADQHLWVLFQ